MLWIKLFVKLLFSFLGGSIRAIFIFSKVNLCHWRDQWQRRLRLLALRCAIASVGEEPWRAFDGLCKWRLLTDVGRNVGERGRLVIDCDHVLWMTCTMRRDDLDDVVNLTVVRSSDVFTDNDAHLQQSCFEREQRQRIIKMGTKMARSVRQATPATTKNRCCAEGRIILDLQLVLEDTRSIIPNHGFEAAEVIIATYRPTHLRVRPLLDLEIGLLKVWLTIRIRNDRGCVIDVVKRIGVVPRTTNRVTDFSNIRQPATLGSLGHLDPDIKANAGTWSQECIAAATELARSCNPEACPRERVLRDLDL